MKILYRYVAKEFVLPFLIGLIGFLIFVSVELLYQLSDIIVQNHVGILQLLVLVYYYMPQFISMGIPVGTLLAIFWVLSNFSSKRELMAFQVHGINLKRIVLPFLMVGVLLSVGTYLVSDYVVPNFNSRATEYTDNVVYHSKAPQIQTNTFFNSGDNYFYVKSFNSKTEEFGNVIMYTVSKKDVTVTYANSATFKDGKWYLNDGRIYTLKDGLMTFDMSFKNMKLDITEDIVKFLRSQKQPQEMSSRELIDRINLFKKLGLDPRSFEVELFSRYANALGALIIAFFGVPFSLFFGIKSKSWGVIVTFVLVVLYQGSGAWLSALGKNGVMNPLVASWMPDLVFGVVGLIFYLLLDSQLMFKLKEKLVRLIPFAVVLLVVIGFSGRAYAAQTLNVSAANLRIISATEVVYTGGVTLKAENYTISASSMKIFFDGRGFALNAVFEGNVVYKQGDREVLSTKMAIELEKNTAVIDNIHGIVKIKNSSGVEQNVYFNGKDSLYDTHTGTSIINDGYITTCVESPPHYKLQASEIYMVPDDHLVAYNLVMYLFGVPLFYLPQYYYSLAGGKQPLEFSVNYAGAQGWYTAAKFNFTPSASFTADAYISSYQKGPSNSGMDLSGYLFKLPYYFSYSNTQSDGSITSEIVKAGISGTLFSIYKTAFDYQNQITGDSAVQNSSLALTGKALGGDLTLKGLQTVSNGVQSYGLPYTLNNLNTYIGNMNVTGNLSGNNTFSMPSKAYSLSNSISGSFSWPVKFFTLNSVTGSYSGSFSQSNTTSLSYAALADAAYAFDALNYDFFGLGLNFSYGAKTGARVSGGQQPQLSDRIAMITNTKLSYNLYGLNMSALYNLTQVGGQNVSYFNTNSYQNNVTFNAGYNFPIVPLNVNSKFSYDFNNPLAPLSNITLTSTSAFKVLGTSNALNTSSIISPSSGPVNTKFSLDSSYGGIAYHGETLYSYGTKSFSTIANKLTAVMPALWFFSNLNMSTQFNINPTNFSLSSMNFEISGGIPQFNLGFDAKGNASNNQLQSMTFNFSTGLDCLGLKGTIGLNTANGINFSTFALTLYIKAFPEKFVSYDPVTGNFNFSFF